MIYHLIFKWQMTLINVIYSNFFYRNDLFQENNFLIKLCIYDFQFKFFYFIKFKFYIYIYMYKQALFEQRILIIYLLENLK